MGNTASQPDPSVKFQVIGAGLPRTGTTSFGAALSTLLDGPCYHGGTQILCSPESIIKRWVAVFRRTPTKTRADKQFVHGEVKELMTGYVGCTDLPGNALVEELMELHPNAKVICTVRDPDRWWDSIRPIVEKGNMTVLSWIFAPLPTLRWFRAYHKALDEGNFGVVHFRPGEPKGPRRITWDRHMEYLRQVVPKERLFFYDVRDGWEPLCAILGVPVPKDVPFPRLNDAQAMEEFMKKSVQRGLMAWAGIALTIAATVYTGLRIAKVV